MTQVHACDFPSPVHPSYPPTERSPLPVGIPIPAYFWQRSGRHATCCRLRYGSDPPTARQFFLLNNGANQDAPPDVIAGATIIKPNATAAVSLAGPRSAGPHSAGPHSAGPHSAG